MSRPRLKPTPADLECWRTLLARDSEAASGLCWRDRPRALFKLESDWASWTSQWAWKPAGTRGDGRWRVVVNKRKFIAEDIVAALEAMGDDTLRPDLEATDSSTGGTLADILEDARRELGLSLGDLTVLSPAHDPYRCATPSLVRDAQWAADRFAEISAAHLRNFHYQLIGRAKKLNGETYSGSNKDWRWLKRITAAARWRRLIPFDALEDRRNSDPVIYRAARNGVALTVAAGADFAAEPPSVNVFAGKDDEAWIFPILYGFEPEQRFLLAIFGEKSSLKPEVEPAAIALGADMYLETGEQSITHAYHIAKRAYQDGRHLVIGVITDCDPSGYQMAVSIARKIQALIDLEFPGPEVDVVHIGLTPDHVRHYRLPESPISAKDKRKARWKQRMGVEQTEVDALIARHRGVLGGLIRDAFRPYFDPTLIARARAAERQWRADAQAAIEAQIADDPELADLMQGAEGRAANVAVNIEALNARIAQIQDLITEINDQAELIRHDIGVVNNDLATIARRIELEPPDVPKPNLPDQPTNGPNLVLSSSWSWIEATDRMKDRKAHLPNDGEDDDGAEDDEE